MAIESRGNCRLGGPGSPASAGAAPASTAGLERHNLSGALPAAIGLGFDVANLTDEVSFTEGDPLFSDLLSPDGTRNRGIARPLFGRTIRFSLTYMF